MFRWTWRNMFRMLMILLLGINLYVVRLFLTQSVHEEELISRHRLDSQQLNDQSVHEEELISRHRLDSQQLSDQQLYAKHDVSNFTSAGSIARRTDTPEGDYVLENFDFKDIPVTPAVRNLPEIFKHELMSRVVPRFRPAYYGNESGVFQCMTAALLESTSDTLLTSADIPFIPGLKNPCYCAGGHGKIETGSGLVSPEDGHPEKRLYCLPYFVLAGCEKSGSGDFYVKLVQHQHVFGAIAKETQWFTKTKWYQDAQSMHNWTLKGLSAAFDTAARGLPVVEGGKLHFEFKGDRRKNNFKGVSRIAECLKGAGNPGACPHILGDFTPRYILDGHFWKGKWYNEGKFEPDILVPQRLGLLLPDVKLIMLYRNPTDRLFSSYQYFGLRDLVDKSQVDFHKRVRSQIVSWETCLMKDTLRRCMYTDLNMFNQTHRETWEYGSSGQLRYGLYSLYLEVWFEVFPQNQFLHIRFEDYLKDPLNMLQSRVLPFLGLEPFSEEALQILNKWDSEHQVFNVKNKTISEMLPETRTMLDEFYSPFNKKLAQLLREPAFSWQDHGKS